MVASVEPFSKRISMKQKRKKAAKVKARTKKRSTPRPRARRPARKAFKRPRSRVFKRKSNPYTDYRPPVLPTRSREATNKTATATRVSIAPSSSAGVDVPLAKKAETRLIKIECPGCGWTGRTTHVWIHGGWHKALGKHVTGGLPTCRCGKKMKASTPPKPVPDVPGQMRAWD